MFRHHAIPRISFLLAAPLVVACSEPPKAGGDAKAGPAPESKAADAATPGDQATTNTPAAANEQKDSPAEKCCRYCLDAQPCGDTCIDEGKTCEEEADGCACPGAERPEAKFRDGDKALAGLIAADVPAYNKAQGDPIDGLFTLEMAFEGDDELADAESGTLYAKFDTTMGAFECELFEKQAPITVASFVGLARGVRPFKDPEDKSWKKAPFFEGILFHRVIDGFMIQTGDPTGTGTGSPGFFVPDEFHPDLRHVGPGILSMANRNRVDRATQKLRTDPMTGQTVGNTGSSQFFVTVAPTPHLDDRHTIFGRCKDASVPKSISKVETVTNAALRMDHKPKEDVKINKVEIYRK